MSCWKLANLCEKSHRAEEAQIWWRKAYETLAGMKQRGLHVSPQDEDFLNQMRAKAAGE